ncbi:MAG: hypothetical protein IJL85_00920 [Erysipelotrichaceae bacterium]|nr:hypothetical protein [Erysipelotrichaceae bacterium]
MKRLVMIDLWLLMIGWCLFLNGYSLAGEAAMAMACLLPLIRRRKPSVFVILMAVCMYWLMLKAYHDSVLKLYFRDLPYLLFFVCWNTVMIYPCMRSMKHQHILLFLFSGFAGAAFISLMILLIPGGDYTLIGKDNLFLLVSFIFLPHLMTMLMAVITKLPMRHLQIKKEALLP